MIKQTKLTESQNKNDKKQTFNNKTTLNNQYEIYSMSIV